jgi:hypothetical protein
LVEVWVIEYLHNLKVSLQKQITLKKITRNFRCWALVSHICNPSYSEGRDQVWSQLRQTVCKYLTQEKPSQQGTGGVAQGIVPEFKSQYSKKRKVTSQWRYLVENILTKWSQIRRYYVMSPLIQCTAQILTKFLWHSCQKCTPQFSHGNIS